MWAGRIREFILVAGLWLLPLAAIIWLGGLVVSWALRSWPVITPFVLGLAAILIIGSAVRWLTRGGPGDLRNTLTHKYWGKIRQARRLEKANPFQKAKPFRLDPEVPAGGLALGMDFFVKAVVSAALGLIRLVAPNARIWPIPFRLVTRYDDVAAVLNNAAVFNTPYGDEMMDMGEGTNFVL
ncbi:MAG: hypothetical protein ACKN9P_03625, partial [Phenylobacterium sp.]